MTPRMEALAFRIWQYANPLGWDVTASDIAEAVGAYHGTVGTVCRAKGWSNRIRKDAHSHPFNTAAQSGVFSETMLVGGIVSEIRSHYARLAEEAPE